MDRRARRGVPVCTWSVGRYGVVAGIRYIKVASDRIEEDADGMVEPRIVALNRSDWGGPRLTCEDVRSTSKRSGCSVLIPLHCRAAVIRGVGAREGQLTRKSFYGDTRQDVTDQMRRYATRRALAVDLDSDAKRVSQPVAHRWRLAAVIREVANVAEALLRGCPDIRIFATSREPRAATCRRRAPWGDGTPPLQPSRRLQ